MRRFRSRDGHIELRLRNSDILALSLMPKVLGTVGDEEGDPAAERLSAPAYPEDDEAQADYVRLMAPELDRQRRLDRAVVESSLEVARSGPVRLTASESDAWLMVINETRLALAARLGIEEEGWGETDFEQESMRSQMAYLLYLTDVQADLIEALGG